MNNPKIMINYLGTTLVFLLLLPSQAAYADIAGYIQFVNGIVQITQPTGQSHDLKKGDEVHENDILTTSKNASTQIKMRDGGLIAMRPDTQFKIDSFKFSGKEDGTEQSFFSLLRGGIRAITGLIGHQHKQSYKIAALSTSIGIRGTDHETYVVLPGSELAATIPAGTYNKVNKGETTMTTDKGTISVLPNQMGYAGSSILLPQLQPVNLKLFNVVPSPLSQATNGKTTATVRDSVVVDSVIQSQDTSPGNILPKDPVQKPIKGTTVPSAPGQVF